MSRSLLSCFSLIALLASIVMPALGWEAAHGDRDNTGFTNIRTGVLGRGVTTVPKLGTFAPGSGPVTHETGTVVIGNEQGRLFAFTADGKLLWRRDLGSGFSIRTAAVLGKRSGGQTFSVYVLGFRTLTDHRVSPAVKRAEAKLFAFTETGQPLWSVLLPVETSNIRAAPPNIWQSGDTERVIVPLTYLDRPTNQYVTRLYAFAPEGGPPLAQTIAGALVVPITGGADILSIVGDFFACAPNLGCDFSFTSTYREWENLPLPGAAVERFGAAPRIVVADRFHTLAGYLLEGTAFREIFRQQVGSEYIMSPPMLARPTGIFYGTDKGVRRIEGRANETPKGIIPNSTFLSPTQLDDRRVMITRLKQIDIVRADGIDPIPDNEVNDIILSGISLPSGTLVPAVASLNHIFVSTNDFFLQYDVATLQKVGQIGWVKGGRVAPAIGRNGWVYAMANNILFVIPPMKNPALDAARPVTGGAKTNAGPGGSPGNAPGPSPKPSVGPPKSQR